MTYLKDLCTVIEKENPKNPIQKNKEFQERYLEYFKHKITQLQLIGDAQSTRASLDKPLIQILTNYSLYRTMFTKKEDSSLYKKIWSLQNYCPLISVYGSLTLNVGNFMEAVCPLKKRPKTDPKDIKTFLTETLYNIQQKFPSTIYERFMTVTSWIVKMNGRSFRNLDDSQIDLGALVEKRAKIIIEGIELCQSIKRSIKQVL